MTAITALHGFTGTPEDFDLLGLGPVRAPTLPGHGPSGPDGACTMDDAARIARQAVTAGGVLLGYSMGGRVALHTAAQSPENIGALVLISASPGIEDPRERAARHADDERLARHIEAVGTARFVAEWQATPLIATQARVPEPYRTAMLQRRQRLRPEGLAACLRGMGAGAMEPLWSALGALPMPVLLACGEEDTKFRHIAVQMAAQIAHATVAIIEGAGHAPHLEAPALFRAALDAFLAKQGCQ
jgi:2-succinyl-6-hydroxy-2,4-cyclohexadiene-1-carboxylate synthase